LRLLLGQPGRYRAAWASRADKVPPSDISQAAVAKVIVDHLRTHGQIVDDGGAYRAIKDRVNRALSGQTLTPSTLRLFSQAFLFSQEDARLLWSRFLGTTANQVSYVIDDLRLPPANAAAFNPRGYRVVSLWDVHHIGANRMPSRHTTRQIIRATTDGLSRCSIRFDIDALTVAVQEFDTSELYLCPDGLYAIDILLPRVLQCGDEQELNYALYYPAPTSDRQRFQRSALGNVIEEACVEVQFSPQRRPSKVWWAIWQERDGKPALREPVELNPERSSVFKKVLSAAQTIFGFCWDW
jgi:hypothetical protein